MLLLPLSWSFLFLCKLNLLFSLEIQSWWLVCFHCQVLLSVSLLLSFTCTLKQRHYVNREQMISCNKASKALLCVLMNCLLSPHIVDQLWNFVLLAISWKWGPSTFSKSLRGIFQARILNPTSFYQGLRLVWRPHISIPVARQEEGHRFWSPSIADIWCHLKRLCGYKVWHLQGLCILFFFLHSFLAVLQYYLHFQRLKKDFSRGVGYLLQNSWTFSNPQQAVQTPNLWFIFTMLYEAQIFKKNCNRNRVIGSTGQ